jgi:ABC-type phosphate transport system substrate-binding protein
MNARTGCHARVRRAIGAAALAVSATLLGAPSAHAAMALVVNPSTPIDNLRFKDVQRIFLGERQYWSADMPVVLIVRGPGARERQTVLSRIYRMTESQFKQYWIGRIFRAEAASTPKVVHTNEMLNELVAAIPGAIALVREEDVQAGVKVVRIDGVLPGERSYPLE